LIFAQSTKVTATFIAFFAVLHKSFAQFHHITRNAICYTAMGTRIAIFTSNTFNAYRFIALVTFSGAMLARIILTKTTFFNPHTLLAIVPLA
jgi:hypothetical protein